MYYFVLLAQRGADSDANRWLNEHPAVLGLIFITIGIVLGGSGAYELKQGVAHDKYGNEVHGGMGQSLSILRIVAGAGVCIFGLYKLIAG